MGRRRVKQKQLATLLGMGQASMSRRLSGEIAFDTDELVQIADYFGVTLADLLRGVSSTSAREWHNPNQLHLELAFSQPKIDGRFKPVVDAPLLALVPSIATLSD